MHFCMNHSLEGSGCQKAFLEIPRSSSGSNENLLTAGVLSEEVLVMLSLDKR